MALSEAEQAKHLLSGGSVARTLLGVQGQLFDGLALHRQAQLALVDVGERIAGVAVGAAKRRGHALGGDGEDEQQLLQIRAVVLAAEGNRRRRAAPQRPAASLTFRRDRLSLGKGEAQQTLDRNLSSESRGLNSLPVKLSQQPEASLACEYGNVLLEA